MVTTVINYHQILSSAESEKCTPCAEGGYCPSTTAPKGGFIKCKKGTFNEDKGKYAETHCIPCDKGFYNALEGQSLKAACRPCDDGTYADKESESCEYLHYSF